MIEASYAEPAPKPLRPAFPYLAKYGTVVVWITNYGRMGNEMTGFILSSSNPQYKVGSLLDRLPMEDFKRWDGSITLTNKKEF